MDRLKWTTVTLAGLTSSLLLCSSLLLSRLESSDTNVKETKIQARLGTAAHFCQVVVLFLTRAVRLFWVCGTNPAALELERAAGSQIHQQAEVDYLHLFQE